MTTHVDVLILGAGPAGAAAALTLRRRTPHLKVLLVQRRSAGGLGPALGETLSAGALTLLDHMGLREQFMSQGHVLSGGGNAAWGIEQVKHHALLFSGMGQGWQIDRRRFDAWLLEEAVLAGAILVRANHTHVLGRGCDFLMRLDDRQITAGYLIDASGRSARLAREMGAEVVKDDELIAQARWYQVPEHMASASESVLIASVPPGWWYTATVPGGRGLRMLMSDAKTFRREADDPDLFWSRCEAASAATMARVQGWQPTGEREIRPAGSQHTRPVCGVRWVAAGDAAVAFDPLVSMGMGFALRSGIETARVAASGLQGDDDRALTYAESILDLRLDYRQRLSRFYQMETRWDTDFWCMRRAFKDPVFA